jgi:NAD(P)-dependent dehydrogenase (short-subunit alcohol dehydrogenase family)
MGCPSLALCDVDAEGVEATHSSIMKGAIAAASLKVVTYIFDVSDISSVTTAFTKIVSDFGRVDYAVNCAGISTNGKSSTDCSPEEFDKIHGVNLRGLWFCEREELRVMMEQTLSSEAYQGIPAYRAQRGAIVNVASGGAIVAIPLSPAYASSKAGVTSLTRCDAIDYSSHKIRVNAVLPGIVDTPMTNDVPGQREMVEQILVPTVPLKRMGQPEEIADLAVFLCSYRASYITAASIVIDGGATAV